MPALPARARAAIRSLFSRPQPSSARMSTATESSCSERSALSGLPGVPVIAPVRDASSYAPRHIGANDGATTMSGDYKLWPFPRAWGSGTAGSRSSGARCAHDTHLQAGAVLGQVALAPRTGDHG